MTEPRLSGTERFTALLEAMLGVASGLSLPSVLRHIVESARDLVGARYAALGVLGDDRQLVEFVTSGVSHETVARIGATPEGHGILGLLIVDPRPLRLADLTRHPKAYGFPEHHPTMRSFLGVPILIGDEVFGNLYLCEKVGADEFGADDEALALSIAAVAAVAVENSRMHARLQDLAVLGDRERIARDLHDKVIQRLFATGLSLQATARRADGDVATRVTAAVDELDSIIGEIRATIFDLAARPADRPTTSAAVLSLVDEMTRAAAVEPMVSLEGPVDRLVAPDLAEDLYAALRELLANVARHSGARLVEVVVHAGDDLVLTVRDDGAGFAPRLPGAGRGRGLANLRARATGRAGSLEIDSSSAGTVIEWRVPIGR